MGKVNCIIFALLAIQFAANGRGDENECPAIDSRDYRRFALEHSTEIDIFHGIVGFNDYLAAEGKGPLFCVPDKMRCDARIFIDLLARDRASPKSFLKSSEISIDGGPTLPEEISAVLMKNFPCSHSSK